MKVSIITPTYNRERLVVRAIQSALDQLAEDIEVVVVDDGSTDNTRKRIEELANNGQFPLRYVWKPNRGCASARNVGLQISNGDAFLFLDSDDALVPDAIATLTKVLEDSGADFVYSPAIEVLADGTESINLPVAAGRPEELALRYFMNTNVRNGAVLFRSAVLERVGGLNESLGHNEDSDFLQRVAISSSAAYSATPTVRVFQHHENKSSDRVAIYEALLASSQSVLNDNPTFRQELGELAGKRLDQLKRHLLRACILNGQFDAAAKILDGNCLNSVWLDRLSVSLHSAAPVLFAALLRRAYSRAPQPPILLR